MSSEKKLLPLYQGHQAEKEKPCHANAGLWFERFFDQFNADADEILEPEKGKPQGKNFWLQKFKAAGDENALQAAAYRQMELVNKLGGKYKFFNTQWHFVTGTGYPHPVENGLAWHPVQGVPYLSGAAVKGLLRAWVEEWTDLNDSEKSKRLLLWFGSDHKDAKDQKHSVRTGDLIFFDALPVKRVNLITDIMTPHYGDWYSNGGKIKDVANESEKVPADWHEPKPIPFLVVDKDTSYLFSIAPRNVIAADRTDMQEVMNCLKDALEWLGAGAKTATGYGGFNVCSKTLDVEKKFKDSTQTLEQKIKDISEKQLIILFSKDYKTTQKEYEKNGYDWNEVKNIVREHLKEKIAAWQQSDEKNKQKAYKNLMLSKNQE